MARNATASRGWRRTGSYHRFFNAFSPVVTLHQTTGAVDLGKRKQPYLHSKAPTAGVH
ncbi:hypothetical protein KCP76_21105 [Salmonella enterica subsp. enterica serovar Weltevreden]|nr:hypothetical protein KCP76_21105 [Salmonella enterica subsp. enterica serovar Weltevreden]